MKKYLLIIMFIIAAMSSIIFGDMARIVSSDIEGWDSDYLGTDDTGFVINLYNDGQIYIGRITYSSDGRSYVVLSYRHLYTFDIVEELENCAAYKGLSYGGFFTSVGYIYDRSDEGNYITFPVRLLDMFSRRYRSFVLKVDVNSLNVTEIDTFCNVVIPGVPTSSVYEAGGTDDSLNDDDTYPILYPNPSLGGSYKLYDYIKSVDIYDVSGRYITRLERANKKDVDHINLNSGTYILVGHDFNNGKHISKINVVK